MQKPAFFNNCSFTYKNVITYLYLHEPFVIEYLYCYKILLQQLFVPINSCSSLTEINALWGILHVKMGSP